MARRADSPYVFTTKTGKRFSKTSHYYYWRAVQLAAEPSTAPASAITAGSSNAPSPGFTTAADSSSAPTAATTSTKASSPSPVASSVGDDWKPH